MANRIKKEKLIKKIVRRAGERKRARMESILNEPDSRAVKISTKRRASAVLAIMLIFGFLGLIVRMGYINIVHGDEYEQKAIEQQLSDKPVYAKRGNIYDRNGKTLATSVSAYTVYLSPAYIKDEEERVIVAEGLSEILAMDYDKLYEMTGKKLQYQLVQRRISDEQTEQIRELIDRHDLSSIGLSEDYKRVYPYSSLLCKVLGFTGSDSQGLYGLEYYYDSYLTGVNGRAVTAQNAVGTDMDFSYETYIDAQDGYNLVLTVDEVIQSFLEKYLQQMYEEFGVKKSTMGIIMDVETGEVLAMGQYPNFDCNSPFDVEDTSVWRNGCISDGYEPGSTFKSLVAAMALEEGVVHTDDCFVCTGSLKVAGEVIHCSKLQGHGEETFTKGLVNSCNPVFMTVASRLGTYRFSKYFSAFGLGQRTGIDLPGEAVGIGHSEESMGPVELAVSSFGQTFEVTPIQLLTAFCAAVNGGNLVQPHVVKEIVDNDGNVIQSFNTTVKRQVVSESTSETLCEMLETVVNEGGSAKNAYVTGYRVGGKTGTSEKTETREDEETAYVASMIAVAPADNPRIAMLIIADEPGEVAHSGGTVAGPAISNILTEVLPYLGVDPVFTESELEGMEISTPAVVDKSVEEAHEKLAESGLEVIIRGDGDTVVGQMPVAGTKIPKGGTVIIYTDGEDTVRQTVVPDVTGLSPSQAAQALSNAGLNVMYRGFADDIEGVLRVYEQSVEPDTPVDEGTVITVYVRVETNDD